MAIVVQNITDEAIQRHTVLLDGVEVVLRLRYFPRQQMWCADVSRGDHYAFGVKLSVGVLHLLSRNFPFDIVVRDWSGTGFDPFRRNDFAGGRCQLHLLEAADMVDIRGVGVQL